jgi:hypothetical protein
MKKKIGFSHTQAGLESSTRGLTPPLTVWIPNTFREPGGCGVTFMPLESHRFVAKQ